MSANCSITQVLLRSTQPFSGKSIQSGHCHSFLKTEEQGTFSVDEWLRKCASTAGETSLILIQGTKLPQLCGTVKKDKFLTLK